MGQGLFLRSFPPLSSPFGSFFLVPGFLIFDSSLRFLWRLGLHDAYDIVISPCPCFISTRAPRSRLGHLEIKLE